MLKILVQVNSSFDLYICTALVRDQFNHLNADLLLPHWLISRLPESLLKSYSQIIGFDPKIRNLFSKAAISESLRLTKWARTQRNNYHAVLFGAYRNDITSLLARHFIGRAGLFAIKQGIDIPDVRYQSFYSMTNLHDVVYYRLFGYGSFRRERLIQAASRGAKGDFIFSRLVWKNDPFDKENNVFTIGISQDGLDDGTPFLLPDFSLIRSELCQSKQRQGILIVGERTPMTLSWSEEQDNRLQEIFKFILRASAGEKVYVRGRKNLSNAAFYSKLFPVFLDPDQLYDDQLLKLNPRLVISVKSTASKVAAYYGFPSLLLYPCLGFEAAELEHLNYLFGDGAPIERIKTISEFAQYLEKDLKEPYIDTQFSMLTRDFFFKRLSK